MKRSNQQGPAPVLSDQPSRPPGPLSGSLAIQPWPVEVAVPGVGLVFAGTGQVVPPRGGGGGDPASGVPDEVSAYPQPIEEDDPSCPLGVLEAFEAVFPPNPVKHGLVLGLSETGQKRVTTVTSPVTRDLVRQHLCLSPEPLSTARSLQAVGCLPGGLDGTTAGAVDLDGKDFDGEDGLKRAARALLNALTAEGVPAFPERSTRGNGWHLWVFTDRPVAYGTFRAALKRLVARAGLPAGTETYPAGENAASTWIILPYAGALRAPRGLGRTFLRQPDGPAIPIMELGERLQRASAGLIERLAGMPDEL
ncbi:MAG TPA: hypothetical protein VHN99_04500, partial [Deinococcales bacterium]|nr:hypothetical protein [Deinococcales bacterium]